MKIPIVVCHGANKHLTVEHFNRLMHIASQLGFSSINYDQLHQWLTNNGTLPDRPIVLDFDHPVLSTYQSFFPVLQKYGFNGNLFVNTHCLEPYHHAAQANANGYAHWNQILELHQAGWTIGAHTHTHPNLSLLLEADPSGKALAEEIKTNDKIIAAELGFKPEYFAFTGSANGITWSDIAEQHIISRYKLGRLWILERHCEVNGRLARYADFMGTTKPDETDGGPPYSLRYITRKTPLYKLPAMELEGLVYQPDAFRRYLLSALNEN